MLRQLLISIQNPGYVHIPIVFHRKFKKSIIPVVHDVVKYFENNIKVKIFLRLNFIGENPFLDNYPRLLYHIVRMQKGGYYE